MLSGALLLGFGLLAAPLAPAGEDPPDLRGGIRLVEDGDLQGAVVRLEEARRALAVRGAPRRQRARVHLYLAMAHLGLGAEEQAREHMRAVWRYQPGLVLDPAEYAPLVIALHRDTRPPAERNPLPTLLGLGAAASVTGVAVVGGGGGSAAPPPATPGPPLGPPSLRLFNCDDDCYAYVNGAAVRHVGLGADSGPVDVRPFLRDGPNEIAFELVNLRAGIAYGFELRLGGRLVFQETCGVVFRTGCENDRRYPPGLVRRFVYTLIQGHDRHGRGLGED
jgi:hypothetical protein